MRFRENRFCSRKGRRSSATVTRAPALSPVQVQRVAAALAIVLDGDLLFGRPLPEGEIVRDQTRAFLELFFEQRADLIVRNREQINGEEVGGAIVLLENVAMDDARRLLQAESTNLLHALAVEIVRHFNASSICVILLGCH